MTYLEKSIINLEKLMTNLEKSINNLERLMTDLEKSINDLERLMISRNLRFVLDSINLTKLGVNVPQMFQMCDLQT